MGIGDKKLSKLFFDAYKDENKPILSLDLINSHFTVKEEKYDSLKNTFIEKVKFVKNLDNNSDDDSDCGDLFDDHKKEIKVFYENDDKVCISNNGLCLYLDLLTENDFQNRKDYYNKVEFINKIGKSAYSSANKIRDLIISQKENIISGLKEIK